MTKETLPDQQNLGIVLSSLTTTNFIKSEMMKGTQGCRILQSKKLLKVFIILSGQEAEDERSAKAQEQFERTTLRLSLDDRTAPWRTGNPRQKERESTESSNGKEAAVGRHTV